MKCSVKNLVLFLSITVGALILSGCGNQKADNNVNTANYSCPAGQFYQNGTCFYVQGNTPAGTPGFVYGNGFYADNYSGTSRIQIVNGGKMQEFFKLGMGVCDRAYISGGQSACTSYIGGKMDMIIQFPNATRNSLLATIIAQPAYNPYVNYSYQLPSGYGMLGIALGWATGIYLPDPKQYNGAYRNPLQLEMAVSAINKDAGFEARGYGDFWTGLNRTVLAIQVQNGKVEDSGFNFNFMVSGTTAAQGTMTRCRTTNCGL